MSPYDVFDVAHIAERVAAFYDRRPYPPPCDDLTARAAGWDDEDRRAESHLFWPSQAYRDDRRILVAGCGTSQAARYALRWPQAQVVGIDVSNNSLQFTGKLKRKYRLANLDLRRLPLEQASELGSIFDHVVCTGVLHHLPDPDAGLRALRDVLAPGGAMNLMVYAPYGRTGIYMLQDYCRRLGIGATSREIAGLLDSLKALPPDHPLTPLLRAAPDFRTEAGLADALLHPQDRSYSVPQLFDFLDRGGLRFGRWIRQAPYLAACGALAALPHRPLLDRLSPREHYAAVELFRGTMVRHSLLVHRSDEPGEGTAISFAGNRWLGYVPHRLAQTITVRERLPLGAAAVLINQAHTYADLYLAIDEKRDRLLAGVDGRRTIGEIASSDEHRHAARLFFQQLWQYDQVAFDASGALGPAEAGLSVGSSLAAMAADRR
jgi:SAM-dependent methyltransferase